MPPTLGALLRTPRLGLRALTGRDRLDRRVAWVAVSELTDPTPYLAGGELVLTTGIRWSGDPGAARAYVRRLSERGVAGLGFGSGVVHPEAPAELRGAAAESGLVLVDVPRSTPFIAVGKEVSRLLAREEYEGLTRAFAAQRELTGAAVEGAQAVVDRLARTLGGWSLLLGADGRPHRTGSAADRARAARLGPEIARLRGAGPRSSASLAAEGEQVSLQPLSAGGRIRGFLAVGTDGRLGAEERTLVNAAASLLSLDLERGAPARGDALRGGIVEALLDGALDPGRPGAARLRALLPAEPVVLIALDRPAGARPLPEEPVDGVLTAGTPGAPVLLAGAEADLAAVREAVGGPIGVSDPVGHADLPAALSQARRALRAARARGADAVRADELPEGFLGLVDAVAGARRARELLAPLSEQPAGADLVASLRSYLASAGRWDAAATSLGVHRHTLRHRIRRVRELLPGDLDDPDYRAELWFALRVLGHPRG